MTLSRHQLSELANVSESLSVGGCAPGTTGGIVPPLSVSGGHGVPSAYITREEAAALAGLSVKTFASYVSRGQNGAPRPARHVGRTPLYSRRAVLAWVAERDRP